MDANQTRMRRDGRTLFKVLVHVALCLDVLELPVIELITG